MRRIGRTPCAAVKKSEKPEILSNLLDICWTKRSMIKRIGQRRKVPCVLS